MNKECVKKALAIAIILVLFSVSVIPSTGNIVEDVLGNTQLLDVVDSSEELLFIKNIVYCFVDDWGNPEERGFYACGPENKWRFRYWGGDWFSAGTWTNDGRLFFCTYKNGTLYEVDPKTLDAWAIGNGGTRLNGLSSDPTTGKLYGASSHSLYEININTGEQTYIGTFGINTSLAMVAIAFDKNGTCYGWTVSYYYRSQIYTIDTNTGKATFVVEMDLFLLYAQDGSFDKETDILYLAGCTTAGGYRLYSVNLTNGRTIDHGPLRDESSDILAWEISYELNMTPPVTTISFDPPEPDGCNGWYVSNVNVTLNATDNTGVIDTHYRINGGEWETYDSPFVISEDGEHTIEYYSYDYVGIIEDVKSETIDIDQIPPETSLKWEVFKKGWKWHIRFILNATDETSGMDNWVEFYINDALQEEFEVLHWPFEFSIPWCRVFKTVTFKFGVHDMAGNSAIELVNGSDIKSYSSGQSSSTQQSQNIWFLRWLDRFPLLQRLLGWLSA